MANAFPVTRVPMMSILFDNSNAGGGIAAWKTLIIGHSLSSGSASLNTPYLITDAAQGASLFGAGSLLETMISSYKKNDFTIELWALSLAECKGSVAATAVITPTIATGSDGKTPVTVQGTVSLYIAGSLYQIGIAATNKVSDVGAALATAINAVSTAPCTAAAAQDTGVVTLSAKHKGEVINGLSVCINLSGETSPTGLSFSCSNFSGGTGNPDLSAAFSSIGQTQYKGFVIPFTDQLNFKILSDELETRWGPILQNDGFAVLPCVKNTQEALTAAALQNSQCVSYVSCFAFPTAHYDIAAAVCAQLAASAQQDPAVPLSDMQLMGVLAPAATSQQKFDDRSALLSGGVSTLKLVGTDVYTERLITTYKKNSSGTPDESYLNAETVLTLSFIRAYVQSNFWSKFKRFKLADDGTKIAAGQKIITPKIAKAELICLFRNLEEKGLVQNVDLFIANVQVVRDTTNRSQLNMLLPPTVMSQLFNVDATIQFLR